LSAFRRLQSTLVAQRIGNSHSAAELFTAFNRDSFCTQTWEAMGQKIACHRRVDCLPHLVAFWGEMEWFR